MSLRDEILNELVSKHREACNLILNLVQAIDLEKKALSCQDEVKSFDLSALTEWTSATIDNLALSDATPVESDHAFRVLHGLFVDLQSNGVNFHSVDSEDEIMWIKSKIPCDYLVKWSTEVDADSPRSAAENARAMLLDPGCESIRFDVLDEKGCITTVDLFDDEGIDLA